MGIFGLDPESMDRARMEHEAQARDAQHRMDEFYASLTIEQMVMIHNLFVSCAQEKSGGMLLSASFGGEIDAYLRYVHKVDPYTGMTEEEQFAKVAEESRESL